MMWGGCVPQADLRNIPIMGWGMRQFEFLFLDRKWESDRQRLYRSVGGWAIRRPMRAVCSMQDPPPPNPPVPAS